MRDMSTRKNPHAPNSCPALQDPYYSRCSTIRNGSNGSHHWPATKWCSRLDPHNCGSRLYSRGSVSPVFFYGHRPEGSSIIPQQCLQVVWPTKQNDLG